MDFFHTKVNAYELKTFKEFVEAVPLNEKDVILTHKFLCDEYMKPLNLPCTYLFYEEYAQGEPNEDMVNLLLGKLSEMGAARIIGIGGGSVMDTAKLLSIDSVKEVLEIFENKEELTRNRGLILIPTTCGTGSEMDGISAVYLNKFGCKIGKSTECCVADKSFLIEELFKKLPYDIFMHTTVDAFLHGLEIYISPLSNPFTNVFCAESVRLNTRNYKKMLESGPDERFKHLTDFIRASSYGGLGLSHNPCGYIHACAMYFGGVHHTPHGQTNAIFMGPVLRLYAKKDPNGVLKDIAKIICEEMGIQAGTYGAVAALENMINTLLPREKLRTFGMPAGKALEYAQSVRKTQNRLVIQSYLPFTDEELASVFEELY